MAIAIAVRPLAAVGWVVATEVCQLDLVRFSESLRAPSLALANIMFIAASKRLRTMSELAAL